MAEGFSDDAAIRKRLRAMLQKNGVLRSVAAKEEDSVYSLYYDFSEPVKRLQSHRVLAINRGEKEGFLKVALQLGRRAPCPASSGTCRPATPTGSCWSRWPRTPGPGCCSPLWSGKSAAT